MYLSQHTAPTHVSSATPPVDTTTPTCSALEGMAGEAPDSFSCSTNTEATRGTCDTVTCDTELLGTNYRAIAKVLPCHTPPAVMMVFLDVGSGRVLLNHTFTRSEEESILSGLVTVSVTLDQLENAIGLQVHEYTHARTYVCTHSYSPQILIEQGHSLVLLLTMCKHIITFTNFD